MSNITPTFESVFNEDYWAPIPETTYYQSSRNLGVILEQRQRGERYGASMARELRLQVDELLGEAVVEVLANNGDPPVKIDEGEPVGGKNDMRYAISGNVLLLDQEMVSLNLTDAPRPTDTFSEFTTMISEYEVAAPALAYFRSMSKMTSREYDSGEIEDYLCLRSFARIHTEPERGKYQRKLDLYVYYPNKRSQIVGAGAGHVDIYSDRVELREPLNGLLAERPVLPAARIGETVTLFVSEDRLSLARIRDAYICKRGDLARAPAKHRLPRFNFGKLATRPAIG